MTPPLDSFVWSGGANFSWNRFQEYTEQNTTTDVLTGKKALIGTNCQTKYSENFAAAALIKSTTLKKVMRVIMSSNLKDIEKKVEGTLFRKLVNFSLNWY